MKSQAAIERPKVFSRHTDNSYLATPPVITKPCTRDTNFRLKENSIFTNEGTSIYN
jgi:hypothetical protein